MLWFSHTILVLKIKDLVGDYQPDEDFILAFTKYHANLNPWYW